MAPLLLTAAYAKDTTLKLTYGILDFDNSKKKDQGKRVGISLDYKQDKSLYQLLYEKTDTDTFQPPLTKDLKVDKYYLKYSYRLDGAQTLSASYATIDDNLMKETNGGAIYGLGYQYGMFGFTQYLSDYNHFNVYQSDLKYTFNRELNRIKINTTVIEKYIHLEDKESNDFSKNTKENYLTTGVKMHVSYNTYHVGVGAFFGKRVFAVMNDGFKVQHHAMEFKETYMIGFGKHFDDIDIHVKYVYQKASEIPISNDNVKLQNVIVQLGYHL
jgi:hypothetical protein